MKIGLLGYGTVGSAVARIVEQRCPELEVARILVLPEFLTEPRMTANFDDIVNDPAIDVVVEAIGGIEPAHTYIARALAAGKHVVTSNKAVVAAHLEEFIGLADKHGVHLYVEACVGGGIPWIASILKARRIDEVTSFSGILNGTSNYLLDRMAREGVEFDEVLADAQRLGLAEADPSADIDGYDLKNKAVITAAACFGTLCRLDLPCFGIRTLTTELLGRLREKGLMVKFMLHGRASGTGYAAAVEPTLMASGSVEAAVPENYNIATLEGATIGTLKFYGQGAGGDPTGNAVVQDLLDCAEGRPQALELTRELAWEPELLRCDHVIAVNEEAAAALPADAEPFAEGMYLVPGRTHEELAAIMAQVAEKDPAPFAAMFEPAR